MALIHVIIPVYNAKPFLQQTVASVLNQPCKDIDIVLVDDGSTDGSSILCDEIAAKEARISVIHQENAGVSAARNAGIAHFLGYSKDGYIAFLDADDLWCPNVFTNESINTLIMQQADIVGFSTCGANMECSKFRILHKYKNKELHFEEQYQTSFLWAHGTFAAHLYHIDMFHRNPILFDPQSKQNEDVIFSAKMLFCAQKILLTGTFLYIYRANVTSTTHIVMYTPNNATFIPDSWYRASLFFANNPNIPVSKKENWNVFCLETSAVRCLEMVKFLALGGYSCSEIENCFQNKFYYQLIHKLNVNSLAPWQQKDLLMFQNNFVEYCTHYRKFRFKYRARNIFLHMPLVRKLKDIFYYTLSLNDINLCREITY